MAEHLAPVLYYAGVHLLYASVVWMAAGVLTAVPLGSATAKYWIWLATSLNFVLPTGALADKLLTPHLTFARPLGFIGDAGLHIAENRTLALLLASVWLAGASLMAARLCLRLRSEGRNMRNIHKDDSRRTLFAHGIPVTLGTSPTPAVDGVLHPHISLPGGIDHLLNERELNAVLLHEWRHAKRRDNLIRLVHEVVLCALWFHPLVWITNSRLFLYRELSCDELVIQNGHGRDLVTALSKLAGPEQPLLLQARAASFLCIRLTRLMADRHPRMRSIASALLALAFACVLTGGVFETVAHTACCFMARK